MNENRKDGVLSNIIGLFARNWGLKLLALALAVLIYQTLKPRQAAWSAQEAHDRTINQY